MKFQLLFVIGFVYLGLDMTAQDLPYHQIPDAPEEYTAAAVAARVIDGLGYRYYWATEDLRPEDLDYRPSEDSRTTQETLDHLYGLSKVVLNAFQGKPNIRPAPQEELTWTQQRQKTLENFKGASDLLRVDLDRNVSEFGMVFQRGDNKSEFPIWNLLNGPLADAIYHTGQIVAFRRASGNPLPLGVNVFLGKTRE